MASDLENHHKPNMHRDIQIIIGEQITAGLHGKIIHDGLFNLLVNHEKIKSHELNFFSLQLQQSVQLLSRD
jgi:hypothetical protein